MTLEQGDRQAQEKAGKEEELLTAEEESTLWDATQQWLTQFLFS